MGKVIPFFKDELIMLYWCDLSKSCQICEENNRILKRQRKCSTINQVLMYKVWFKKQIGDDLLLPNIAIIISTLALIMAIIALWN